MKHLYLCGFMGSGKSTVGKALAAELFLPFCDTDEQIAAANGPIPALFASLGQKQFRALEQALLAQQSCVPVAQVIALGGGALDAPGTLSLLQKTGAVIWLDVPFSVCYARIKQSDRPLVSSLSKNELHALYLARRTSYQSAASLCVGNSKSVLATTTAILTWLQAQK